MMGVRVCVCVKSCNGVKEFELSQKHTPNIAVGRLLEDQFLPKATFF